MTEQPISGKMRFDPVLNWGHVLTMITIMLSGFVVYNALDRRSTEFAFRIQALETFATDAKNGTKELLNELKAINSELVRLRVKIGDQALQLPIRPGN